MSNKAVPLKMGFNSVSNFSYHADREYVSSSVLKKVYYNIAEYKKEYIDGIKEPVSPQTQNSFDEGSFCHAMALEPDKLNEEFAMFPGSFKRGAEFDAFVAANPGKTIISNAQRMRVESYVAAYKRDEDAMELMTNFSPEHTVCGEIEGVKVKVRFDAVDLQRSFVADIKTTARGVDPESFKAVISQFSYQLSGGLYTMVAEQFYGTPHDFYFIAISKQDLECRSYRMGKATMQQGREMVRTAIRKLAAARELDIWTETELAEAMGVPPKLFTGLDNIEEL